MKSLGFVLLLSVVATVSKAEPPMCLLYLGEEDCFEASPSTCPNGGTCHSNLGYSNGGWRCPSTLVRPLNYEWRDNGNDAPQTYDKFTIAGDATSGLRTMSTGVQAVSLNCAKGGNCGCLYQAPTSGVYGATGTYICFTDAASFGVNKLKYFADWDTQCPSSGGSTPTGGPSSGGSTPTGGPGSGG